MLSDAGRLTPAHRRILLLAWGGWLFDFYDLILYSFLLTDITRELGLSREQHSLILGMSLGMTALGGVVCGILADRFGRRPILQITILAYSTARTALLALRHGPGGRGRVGQRSCADRGDLSTSQARSLWRADAVGSAVGSGTRRGDGIGVRSRFRLAGDIHRLGTAGAADCPGPPGNA